MIALFTSIVHVVLIKGRVSCEPGKMPTVQLLFDEDFAYAGSVLNGAIKIGLKQPHELKDVYLTLEGKQEVRLLERKTEIKYHTIPVTHYDSRNNTSFTHTMTYTTTNTYTVPHEHTRTLINDRILVQNVVETLPAGEHFIRFSVELPATLPASHNKPQINLRESGYNAYTATASVRLRNTLFTSRSDLIVHQALTPMQPLQAERQFNLGTVCCFWSGGILTVRAGSGKNSYAPNEAISIDLSVCGKGTEIDLTKSQITLYEFKKYTSGTYSTSDFTKLCCVDIPTIKGGQDFHSSFLLQVPPSFNQATWSDGIITNHFIEINLKSSWTDENTLTVPVQLYLQNSRIVDRSDLATPVSMAADSTCGSPKMPFNESIKTSNSASGSAPITVQPVSLSAPAPVNFGILEK